MNNVKRKRNNKTNPEQLEILICFLKNNKHWLTTANKSPDDEFRFDLVCSQLNQVIRGARKTKEEWKRFIITWKSKTKSKARMYKDDLIKTGNGSNIFPNLSEQEQQLMALVGWNVIDRYQKVPEVEPDRYILMEELQEANNRTSCLENLSDTSEQTNGIAEDNVIIVETPDVVYKHNNVNEERETSRRRKRVQRNLAIRRKRAALQSAANTYLAGSENLLQAAKFIAESINSHAAALSECALAIRSMQRND